MWWFWNHVLIQVCSGLNPNIWILFCVKTLRQQQQQQQLQTPAGCSFDVLQWLTLSEGSRHVGSGWCLAPSADLARPWIPDCVVELWLAASCSFRPESSLLNQQLIKLAWLTRTQILQESWRASRLEEMFDCPNLLQVFVETLDKCFENVCELDLIFHMDKVSRPHMPPALIWNLHPCMHSHIWRRFVVKNKASERVAAVDWISEVLWGHASFFFFFKFAGINESNLIRIGSSSSCFCPFYISVA